MADFNIIKEVWEERIREALSQQSANIAAKFNLPTTTQPAPPPITLTTSRAKTWGGNITVQGQNKPSVIGPYNPLSEVANPLVPERPLRFDLGHGMVGTVVGAGWDQYRKLCVGYTTSSFKTAVVTWVPVETFLGWFSSIEHLTWLEDE